MEQKLSRPKSAKGETVVLNWQGLEVNSCLWLWNLNGYLPKIVEMVYSIPE